MSAASFGGIAGHGTDEAGIATAEEAKARDIKTGRRRDPASVDDLTGGIEHRHVQPAIIASESSSPDDGPDAVGSEVQRRRRGSAVNGAGHASAGAPMASANTSMRWRRRSIRACEPAIASARLLLSCSTPPFAAGDATDKPHTHVAQHQEIEIVPLGSSNELHRRLPSRSLELRG